MLRWSFALAASFGLLAGGAFAQSLAAPRPGEVFVIDALTTSESQNNQGGSGSSRSSFQLVERVIAVGDNGTELEFDLPFDASSEDRAREWQYPARVMRRSDGQLVLLNAPELEARLSTWLELGELSREACGRWFFTWNAFKVECDVQAVLATLEAIDVYADARAAPQDTFDGMIPRRSETQESLDAENVRQERIAMDAVIAEIMGPSQLQLPPRDRQSERISGTVQTSLSHEPASGRLTRRRTTNSRIEEVDGRIETMTVVEVIDRRRASESTPP